MLVNRAFEGRTGRAFVGQLSEEKALQNAGKLASEAFIMTVGDAYALAACVTCKSMQPKQHELMYVSNRSSAVAGGHWCHCLGV